MSYEIEMFLVSPFVYAVYNVNAIINIQCLIIYLLSLFLYNHPACLHNFAVCHKAIKVHAFREGGGAECDGGGATGGDIHLRYLAAVEVIDIEEGGLHILGDGDSDGGRFTERIGLVLTKREQVDGIVC